MPLKQFTQTPNVRARATPKLVAGGVAAGPSVILSMPRTCKSSSLTFQGGVLKGQREGGTDACPPDQLVGTVFYAPHAGSVQSDHLTPSRRACRLGPSFT